jgi:D-alanyl-D-alanine carboxypeptidase (penicillin-binding protein 5/6)
VEPGELKPPQEVSAAPIPAEPAPASEPPVPTDVALVVPPVDAGPTEAAQDAVPTEMPVASAPPEEPTEGHRFFRRRARAQHRKARRRWPILVTLGIVIAVLAASGTFVAERLGTPPPIAVVRSTTPLSQVVPGAVPAIPWPAGVQSAVSIPGLGVTAQSGPEVPLPIASVTKLMTAHIVLTDFPLLLDQEGSSITITPNDVELWQEAVDTGQANIQVAVGEVLTEHQMLLGMLVHSANNFADLLAIFDAGSISAFVTKMNASAAALGMAQTQYVDASGYSTQTTSTAIDQLKIATVDVGDPVFDQIVEMPAATFPITGVVGSYTPFVGVDGVVGLKSGFTSAAGGCDVLALLQVVDGVPLEVLTAVVGEHVGTDVITNAGLDALTVARSAMSNIRLVDVAPRGTRFAVATVARHSVPIVAGTDLQILAWPGQRVIESLDVARQPRAGTSAGWSVGTITLRLGTQDPQVEVHTGKRLPSLTFLQRVF